MKNIKKRIKNAVKNNCGLTLTELLVAMTLLVVVSICFLPLFQTYYGNIVTTGQVTQERFESEGLIEKLIGMQERNLKLNDYSTETANIPLTLSVKGTTIATQAYGLNNISGETLSSVPEDPVAGYNTFVGNSVTSKMVCYPQHIADDFLEKKITLFAAGFNFSTESKFDFYVTDSEGNRMDIPQDENDGTYYKIEIGEDSHIATLTLKGDNSYINFEHSPLVVTYEGYPDALPIEIDAPTVIMVGKKGADGYYYYVTSGEVKNDGSIDIIRKDMASADPYHPDLGTVKLTSAMNDVEWVAAGEGDDGNGNTNQYGYYVMCGDNGQIRRFWRNETTGNYYFSGDNTIPYQVNSIDQATSNFQTPDRIVGSKTFSTVVDTSYAYSVPPRTKYGQNLISQPFYNTNSIIHPDFKIIGAYDRLMTQNVYSINALSGNSIYTLGTLLYVTQNKSVSNPVGNECKDYKDTVLNSDFQGAVSGMSTGSSINGVTTTYYNTKLSGYKAQMVDNSYRIENNVVKKNLGDMQSYYAYNGITDTSSISATTLTSVGSIKMRNTYSSTKYPTGSYTLYCGYVPAVMDIWTDNNEKNSVPDRTNSCVYTTWRATLGLAFNNDAAKSYYLKEDVYRGTKKGGLFGGTTYNMVLVGHAFMYGTIPASEYSVSGVCSPLNYKKYDSSGNLIYYQTLNKTLNDFNSDAAFGPEEYPLNLTPWQQQLMNQNETVISIAYLSNPYAFADVPIQRNYYDLSSSRKDVQGVLEWCFDDSLTIMDMDSIDYESYDGTNFNENNFSIAVGYVVAGLLFEQQGGDYKKYISTPTVMNNGIVFMRSGGADNPYELDISSKSSYKGDRTASCMLTQESNIFHQFYYTDVYNETRNVETALGKNTLMLACSANYWRDAYHPMFYSTYGGLYSTSDARDKFSYIMTHALQDKRLTCTSWGWTWENAPEAMWGASDGTLMSWYLDTNNAQSTLPNETKKVTPKTTAVEFQSYQQLEYANEHYLKYDTTEFEHQWVNTSGITWFDGKNTFNLPLNWEDMNYSSSEDGDLNNTPDGANSSPGFSVTSDTGRGLCGIDDYYSDYVNTSGGYEYCNNSYWDKCSVELENLEPGTYNQYIKNNNTGYGMISPLKSVDDVAYANDTWVACGVQGLDNPKVGTAKYGAKTRTVYYCQDNAVVSTSTTGSWICVRHWLNVQNNDDKGPCDGNSNYQWQVIQISSTPNCNIHQVTYANGMWYAVGYIDSDKDGEQDSTEHAVVFYTSDPTKACGQDGGWKLSDPGGVGYTQCWKNNGGSYDLMDIEGINAVASRND